MDKQKRFKMLVGAAIAVLFCLVLAPVIILTFKSFFALLAMLIAGTVVFTFAPVFVHQLSVWKYKSLRAVVSRDPISSLIALQKKRHERLEKGRQNLQDQRTALSEYRRNCNEMIKKYPDQTQTLTARLTTFENMFAFRVDAYNQAKKDYSAAEEQLKYLEMEYDNAVAAFKAGQAFGQEADFFDKLVESTAVKAVYRQVDESMAQMEIAMIDAHAQQQIDGIKQHTISYDASGNVVLGDILEPIKERV